MADGWRAAPEPNALLMEFANLLRNPLGLTQDPTERGKLGAFSDTLSEVLFGGAPDEIQKWSEGNSPFYSERRIPELKSDRKLPTLEAVSSLPIATALKGGKAAAAGGGALAGVVKGKGGSWIDVQEIQNAFRPEKPPYGNDRGTREAFREFDRRLRPDYEKRVDQWGKNLMGSEADPLINEFIGETPYTFGELGDQLVGKIDPKQLRFEDVNEIVRGPGGRTFEDAEGNYLRAQVPRGSLVDKNDNKILDVSDRRMIELLRDWSSLSPEEQAAKPQYFAKNSGEAISELMKTPKKVRKDLHKEQRWVENPETGEKALVWVPGKKIPDEELPVWNDTVPNPDSVLYEELASMLSKVGEYGGEYYPKDKTLNASFPDIIKTWPKDYELKEVRNIAKNQAGVSKLDIPSSDPDYAWYKVDTPEALEREGKMMRHCIGGYCDELSSGQMGVMSLRDKYMTPRVTVSTDVKKPTPVIPEHVYWEDIPNILRDPAGQAGQRGVDLPQGVEPLRDPDAMARILRMQELAQNVGHYEDNIAPELAQFLRGGDDGGPGIPEILRQGLPPEDWARIKPLFEAEGPEIHRYNQVKGRANHPVADKYQQALADLLHSDYTKDFKPGKLEQSEATYARRAPIPLEGGGYRYADEKEVRGGAMDIVNKIGLTSMTDLETRGNEIRSQYGREVYNTLYDLVHNKNYNGRSIEDQISKLPMDELRHFLRSRPK